MLVATKFESRTIEEAYKELTQEGFAAWVRLMVAKPEELSAGRGAVAKLLNYSEGRSNAILRELKFKQYIQLLPAAKPGLPTALSLVKRCKLVGRSNFVRLSRVLSCGASTAESEPEADWLDDLCSGLPLPSPNHRAAVDCCEATDWAERPTGYGLASVSAKLAQERCAKPTSNAQAPTDSKRSVSAKAAHKNTGKDELDDFYSSLAPAADTGVVRRPASLSSKNGHNKDSQHKAAGKTPALARIASAATNKEESIVAPRSKASHGAIGGQSILDSKKGLDLSKLPTREERRAKRVLEKSLIPSHPEVGQPIDWTRFDLNDKPIVSFDPEDSEREKMIEALSGDSRRMSAEARKLRKQLVDKLRQEFARVYERYRRAVLRSNGARVTLYTVLPGEQKYAEASAIACIMRGVTPTQVFQYWHENIGNFADSKMPVPPLTFLSQPSNIDAVAIAAMGARKSATLPPRGSKPKRDREASMHPLSDVSLLHPGLRRSLMEAGFDLSKINDKYLVTVQAYALDVAHGGEELRFIPEAMRGMVGHAAAKVYKDVDPDDYL